MRATLAACALACCCAGVDAVEIGRYATHLDVAADGNARATVELQVSGGPIKRLRLPIGFGSVQDVLPRDLPAGAVLTAHAGKTQSLVEVEFPDGAPAQARVAFSFAVPGVLFVPKPEPGQKPTLPAGSRILRHQFVNTQELAIASYRVEVRLPEESMVHKINEQLPKPRRKEVLPRVELDRIDGRQGAVLQFGVMSQGDRTSMELEVVPRQRSRAWIFALLPLAGLYLFAFRDLVRPARA